MNKRNPDYTFINRADGRTGLAIATTMVIATLFAVVAVPHSFVMAKTEPAHVASALSAVNINDGFAELVKAVKPAVVNISVTGRVDQSKPGRNNQFRGQTPQFEEFFRRFFGDSFKWPQQTPENHYNPPRNRQHYERRSTAVGSGFIIDPDGFVVTNYHVVENVDEIEVVLDDGTRIPAELRGTDKKTDLALLEIKTDKPLPYVEFGNSDDAQVGDWVIAIGNPFGLGGTTTSGIISARGRDVRSGQLNDFIQIDASINRGNSGGPLFNIKGQVIGVNSMIYSPNGGSVGIGFAIPSAMANNVIAQLQENGVVQRGYLGVYIQELTAEIAESLGLQDESGALVTEVIKNSPARAAGIEPGDVIRKYDGRKVATMRDLPRLVALTKENREVDIELWRNNHNHNIRVTIGMPDAPSVAGTREEHSKNLQLGLELAEANESHIEKYGLTEGTSGVIIVDVDPQSMAARRGLREGDIIRRIDRTDVSAPDDVVKAIKQSKEKEKKSILLLVQKGDHSRFVVVPITT